MNRAARRRKQFNQERHPMGQKTAPLLGPMTVRHGHTDTHIVMVFSQRVTQLTFTPDQAVALVAAVYEQLANLAAHQMKKGS